METGTWSWVAEEVAETVAKGGWTMVPLYAVGLCAWILALLQWSRLGRLRADADRIAEEAFAGKSGASVEAKTGILEEVRAKRIPETTERLRTVSQLAAAAPLLGLLGTVTGMRASFSTIMLHGFGNPVLLADGISEALLTTQAGLVVAFPLVLFSVFLRNRAARTGGEIEEKLLRLRNAGEAAR